MSPPGRDDPTRPGVACQGMYQYSGQEPRVAKVERAGPPGGER
jgi:hypothetical protein